MTATTYQQRTALLGMTIFLASWAMLFAALFFSYGVVRVNAHVWPPFDQPPLPLALPGLATVVLAGASAALVGASRFGRIAIAAAALLGTTFLALQLRVWTDLFTAGLRPDAGGAYPSVFWGFTVFHALHVVVGLGGLGYVIVRGTRAVVALRLWSVYWHMVGVVWALMFVTIYVL